MPDPRLLTLALFDFIPSLFFIVGAFFLVRMARLVRGERCARMALAGCLLIALGGLLKALWKLLLTLGIADIPILSDQQFVLIAPGFLALLIVAILMARMLRSGTARLPVGSSLLLMMAGWKIPFLAVMTLSSMGAQGILTYMAFQRKQRIAAVGFIVAFLCLLGMGSMASGEQTITRQWLEESINTAGQLGFALGSGLLYRNFKNSSS